MPRVLNKYKDKIPSDAIYVGRPTRWGNPFRMDDRTSRESAVQQHREWLLKQDELLCSLWTLRGKDLVCFCAPKPCHADILLELANRTPAVPSQDTRAPLWKAFPKT